MINFNKFSSSDIPVTELNQKPKKPPVSSSDHDAKYDLVYNDGSKIDLSADFPSHQDESKTELKKNYNLPAALLDVSNDMKVTEIIRGILHPKPINVDIPDDYLCQITGELMRDPVNTTDGHTYEREAIEEWLKEKNISPATGAPLENKSISSAVFVKKIINTFIEKNQDLKDSTEWYLPQAWIKNLQEACKLGNAKTIQEICNLDRRLLVHTFQRESYKGKTALHLAAVSHPISLDTVIDLLDKRQNGLALLALLQSDAEGRLPLHLAVLASQSAETLLKLMAWMGNYLDQVNLVEGWPENLCLDALNQALIWSIPHRDLSKIGCLLRLGANPNIKNNLGQTPLHIAAANNQVEIVKLLIGHKTLLDIQDDEGNTALHVAMEKQANAVMKMLLLESASTSIKNKKQLLPRQIAQIAGYTNTVSQYDETIKELMSKEQNLLRHDLFGFFFLKQQRCIETQQREILALLKKIEIQEAKITDLTIQHKAQDHEIKQLKQEKVDTNYFKIQDNKYNNFFNRYEPMLKNIRQERLGHAQNELVRACISGDLKQVKLAIQAGASPDLADSKNILPVGAAIYGMSPEIVAFLLSLSGNHTTMSWEEWEKHNKEKFQRVFEQDQLAWHYANPMTYSALYNGVSGTKNRKIQECILSEARDSKDVGFSKAASSINSLLGHILNAKEWHNPYSEQGIRQEVHFSDNYYEYPIGESNRYATSQAIWKVPAKLQAAIKEVFKKHHELLTASSKQPSNLVNIGSSASISSSSSNSSSSKSTVYLP